MGSLGSLGVALNGNAQRLDISPCEALFPTKQVKLT
jgi:hypothetical protein